ncbi:phosphotransferase [Erythrobacter sp. HKB08]|uniref:phosphotransferase n=1 Tax=Erythrobacter sp. HKB08 TaxID=2502843 RepID=UPI00100919FE|nr:phosphotransferase [Erythrobacter sp. HKB08]
MSDFPSHPDAVTPDWLTDCLRRDGRWNDVVVNDVGWQAIGTGQVGDSVRFTLRCDGEGPATLAGKFPAADETSRGTAVGFGLYAKEVGFYREIAPHLATRTPHCFAAHVSDDGSEFILLMEDCGPAEQGNQLEGCSDDHAREAMRQLAGLHGPSWGKQEWFAHDWLDQKPEMKAMLAAAYPQATAVFADRYRNDLPTELMEICHALGAHAEGWVQREADKRCLVHGDFRLDNMLFDIRGGAEPMATLDWQTLVASDGLVDVGYFLGAGIKPEQRERIGDELLGIYRKSLAAHGVERDEEEEARGLRWGALHGVSTAVFSAAFVERTERGDKMFLAMADGATRLARELDALQVLEEL